jgi:lysophospholipase L1-like esterase
MHRWRYGVLLAFLTLGLGPGAIPTPGAAAPVSAPAAAAATNRFDREIAAFVERDRRQPPQPGGIVFYGSSSFRLWTNLAAAFPGHRVVNRGFGGSQLSDLIHHFPRVIPPHAPSLLLIYGGDNDLASGKSAERVETDFRALVELVRRCCPRTRVAFVAIKPSPSRLKYLKAQLEANDRVRRFAARHRRVDYLDTATPVLDAAGQPDPRFFLADRLHLNGEGYRAWEAVVAPYLDRWDR